MVTVNRAGGVKVAHSAHQPKGGGSIPASALFFQRGRIDEVRALVKQFHYSRRWPGNVQFVGSLHFTGGMFGDSGDVVCGACFSIPPTRWSEPVMELSRLVRRDDAPGVPLTLLLKLCCTALRVSGVDLVVSFADRTQRHHGGIYQAASWHYAGCRESRMDGLVIDGAFYAGRSCNSRWGTQSPGKLRKIIPHCTIEPHYDEGKHLYWRSLNQIGKAKAARLGLQSLSYPKN